MPPSLMCWAGGHHTQPSRTTMTTFETMLLLSTAILVSGLTAAAADPLKDDLDAIRNEFCEGEPFKECLAKFRADMASKQGYQEAALQVCPRMVVTDPQL